MPKKYKYRKTFTFDGSRYSVYGDTEAEVIEKATLKRRDLEEGRVILDASMKVSDWTKECIETYKVPHLSDIATENIWIRVNKYIIDPIGSMRLKDVKPLHLQRILNEMEGMSADYIGKIHGLMNFVFRQAVANELLIRNPAENLTVPKGTTGHRRAITEYERQYILEVADTDPRWVYFLFQLLCGLRPSEAAELKGMDIQGDRLHVRGTKTAAADRIVPIPEYLISRIPDAGPFDYLFTVSGHKLTTSNRRRWWTAFLRQLNITAGCRVYRNQLIPPYPIADDLTPYCLRHTYCSDLCRAGVDIRTAQKLMGHANISITANIYTHIDSSQIDDAAEKMKVYQSKRVAE